MTALNIIRAMRSVGCSDAQIVEALEKIEEERLAQGRARVAKHRANKRNANVTPVTGVTSVTDAPAHIEHARAPGGDNPSTVEPTEGKTPSLRSGDVHSERKAIDAEFDETFWPAYPHKVSKGAARKAWLSARRKASLETIMAGLRRYVETKAPHIDWRNPATFLNGEGWEDQPQAPPVARSHSPPGRQKSMSEQLSELTRQADEEFFNDTPSDANRSDASNAQGTGPDPGHAVRGVSERTWRSQDQIPRLSRCFGR